MNARHMRYDLLAGEWVIYAPGRSKRPAEGDPAGRSDGSRRESRAASCPFCPGNEHLLPPILFEAPGPEPGTWDTRVVSNLFPAVDTIGTASSVIADDPLPDFYRARPAYGRHEVLIESPRHHDRLETMGAARLDAVLGLYQKRYLDVRRTPGIEFVALFRNGGIEAGASLAHPHAQIIGLETVPESVRAREERARLYRGQSGRCLMCDVLAAEVADGRRLVCANEAFVAFVPFAAHVPFQVWVVPRHHRSDFGEMGAGERTQLGPLLHEALARLVAVAGADLPYNLVVHPASSAGSRTHAAALHWYLEARPRLTVAAGFEVSTAVMINPDIPEDDAALLRLSSSGTQGPAFPSGGT